jgi:hypothetical protein
VIVAVYYDEYGRKVGESIETDADFSAMLPKRPPSTVPQVTDDWKGAQRRPARQDNTDAAMAARTWMETL